MRILNNTAYKTFLKTYKEKRRLLMLDYDGTLAAFSIERNKAYIYKDILDILNKIQNNVLNKVVIITGRTLSDILPLLKDLHDKPEIFGSHGFERLDANGNVFRYELDRISKKILDDAMKAVVEKIPNSLVERKYASVAIHTRGLDEETSQIVRKTSYLIFEKFLNDKFFISEFNGGLELRNKIINKGYAVNTLMNENKDFKALYIGDDYTDEDAFKMMKDKGLSILIDSNKRETKADVVMESKDELKNLLIRFI